MVMGMVRSPLRSCYEFTRVYELLQRSGAWSSSIRCAIHAAKNSARSATDVKPLRSVVYVSSRLMRHEVGPFGDLPG